MRASTKGALLVFFFSLCASAALLTHRVRDRTLPPVPRELYAIVNHQITACRSHDLPGAYRYAASGVQQKFTVPQFAAMMRRNYPELARAQRIEFGEVKVRGGSAIVQVFFFGSDDSVRSFLYSLVAEAGSWKIDGAEEVRAAPLRRLSGSHA